MLPPFAADFDKSYSAALEHFDRIIDAACKAVADFDLRSPQRRAAVDAAFSFADPVRDFLAVARRFGESAKVYADARALAGALEGLQKWAIDAPRKLPTPCPGIPCGVLDYGDDEPVTAATGVFLRLAGSYGKVEVADRTVVLTEPTEAPPEPTMPALTAGDAAIVTALGRAAPALVKQDDLVGDELPSRRTLAERLPALEKAGLVHRPGGPRSGYTLTKAGMDCYKSLSDPVR